LEAPVTHQASLSHLLRSLPRQQSKHAVDEGTFSNPRGTNEHDSDRTVAFLDQQIPNVVLDREFHKENLVVDVDLKLKRQIVDINVLNRLIALLTGMM